MTGVPCGRIVEGRPFNGRKAFLLTYPHLPRAKGANGAKTLEGRGSCSGESGANRGDDCFSTKLFKNPLSAHLRHKRYKRYKPETSRLRAVWLRQNTTKALPSPLQKLQKRFPPCFPQVHLRFTQAVGEMGETLDWRASCQEGGSYPAHFFKGFCSRESGSAAP